MDKFFLSRLFLAWAGIGLIAATTKFGGGFYKIIFTTFIISCLFISYDNRVDKKSLGCNYWCAVIDLLCLCFVGYYALLVYEETSIYKILCPLK